MQLSGNDSNGWGNTILLITLFIAEEIFIRMHSRGKTQNAKIRKARSARRIISIILFIGCLILIIIDWRIHLFSTFWLILMAIISGILAIYPDFIMKAEKYEESIKSNISEFSDNIELPTTARLNNTGSRLYFSFLAFGAFILFISVLTTWKSRSIDEDIVRLIILFTLLILFIMLSFNSNKINSNNDKYGIAYKLGRWIHHLTIFHRTSTENENKNKIKREI